ncbi:MULTISPECIES: sulfate transporter family protein [Pseudovibrio]|uniref:sulfate transporter family protein n=1 Tax=Stappiaceae TaxID=2821832 RepID=UPI0023663135|nr:MULTISPECIES: sulfate transporter family protein [Pseudovibrio]MDD7909732.1 sulfate transporter family protein [Pseudovibrio exalbescens]MDX5592074.1 sulfate transporter family protein [Pseudovibrio sp. SPO723]
MIAAALRSFSQVFQPEYRHILLKSIGLTIGLLAVIWIVIQALFANFVELPYPWLETVLGILTGVGAFIGLGFLIAPASALFVAFYQDDIAELVEQRDYPYDPSGKALPVLQSLGIALKFLGVVILGNICALLLLLVPGVNLVAFFLVNGYLLGREFFEFAAMRFMSPEDARALRRANGGTVFFGGLLIALVLAVPILNLITPMFATIYMVHIFKQLRGRAPVAA